jgi:hemoglobin-like flavoprotein
LKHARGVIGMVDTAVALLEKGDMDTLVAALKDLGAKHATYDVTSDHYPIVGQALLDTLEKALGDDFTPEVKEAWAGVYGVITDNMLAGAKQLTE